MATGLRPLGDRVVIKPLAREEVTRGGIVLPDSAQNRPQRGEVIAVGDGHVKNDGNKVPLTVKQGAKVETMLTIVRLYGYNDQVTFTTTPPQGVGGFSIPNVTVPAGQAQIPLVINANADAPPGQYTFKLQATMNLNGQQVTLEQPLTLTVQKAESSSL